MNASFTKALAFSKARDELSGKEKTSISYPRFQRILMNTPRAGAVIQGTRVAYTEFNEVRPELIAIAKQAFPDDADIASLQ